MAKTIFKGFVFYLYFFGVSYGQGFETVEIVLTSGDYQRSIRDMAVDADGNKYLIDLYEESVTIGDTTLYGQKYLSNYYLAKFDPDNQLLWARNFTSTQNVTLVDVEVDTDGGVYVAGKYYKDLIIEIGNKQKVFQPRARFLSYVVAKFDRKGGLLKVQLSKGANDNRDIQGLVVSSNKQVYTLSHGNYRYHVTRWAMNNYSLLEDSFGYKADLSLRNIELDKNNNIFITGHIMGPAYFVGQKNKVWKPNGLADAIIIGLQDDGTSFKDNGSLVIPAEESSYLLIRDISLHGNDIYLLGEFMGTIKINDSTYINQSEFLQTYFAKYSYDNSASTYKVQYFNTLDFGKQIAPAKCQVTHTGELYVIGQLEDTFYIDGVMYVPSNEAGFILKTNVSGQPVFTEVLEMHSWTGFTHLGIDACNRLFVAGGLGRSQALGTDGIKFDRGAKAFFAQYRESGADVDFSIKAHSRSLCPNDVLEIELEAWNMDECNETTLYMSDENGSFDNKVLVGKSTLNQQNLKIPIDQSYEPGQYYLQLIASSPKRTVVDTSGFVIYKDPDPIEEVVGDTLPLAGAIYTYVINNPDDLPVEWTVKNGKLLKGQGTRKIKVKWEDSSTGEIKVYRYVNSTCSSPVFKQQIQILPSSIDAFDFTPMAVYPNPVSNQLTVRLSPTLSEGSIRVIDINGRELQSVKLVGNNGRVIELNLEGVEPGIYLIEFSNDAQKFTTKLWKK